MSDESPKPSKPKPKKYGKGPTKLSDGRYQTKLKDGAGKRVSVYGKTKKECQENANNLRRDVEAGKPTPSKRLTLCEYLTGYREWPAVDPQTHEELPPRGWLGDVVRPSVRAGVYCRYEINVRKHILPALGKERLIKLSADQVQRLITMKGEPRERGGEGLAPRTAKQIFGTLRNALNAAVRKRELVWNVCAGVTPPRTTKPEHHRLSVEAAQDLLERLEGDPLECIVTLALTTGLREAELLGLKWSDMDLEGRALLVRHQVQRVPHEGWQETDPKSKTSTRAVVLTPQGVEALRRQKRLVAEMRLVAGEEWEDRNLVHPNRLGRPIEKGNLLRRWYRFLEKNHLPSMTIHELRHSTATMLLALHVPPKVVQEILGHTSIAITSDIYQDYVPPLHEEAVAALDKLLTRSRITG